MSEPMAPQGLFTTLQLIASFALSVHGAAVAKPNSCEKLADLFGSKVSMPASKEYGLVAPENWSETAQLTPTCLIEPADAKDVAAILAVLVKDGTKFAVRGGGHMPVPGAANIDDGVLISLKKMRSMEMVDGDKIAKIGPGLRWYEVYDFASSYGVGVSGGRYAPVGVPGYLLGGGISFFGSRYGWSSNRVANYEVVLANSTIVNANAKENTDLFWALKGGSSNYGIVTRFDLKTFPLDEVYGGLTVFDPKYLNDFVNAAASFSTIGGGSDDLDASYNPSVQVNAATGAVNLLSWCLHAGPDPEPAAFANFTRIPALSTTNKVWPTLANATAASNAEAFGARTQRQLFMSTGLQPGPDSVRLTNETFFETIAKMPELKKVEGLSLTATPQMLTKYWLQAARNAGGDPMDLEPGKGLLIFLIGTTWENAADDAVVQKFSTRLIDAIDKKAKAKKLDYPYIYVNDAGASQKPFRLYGQGKSLKKMKTIRDKYDPQRRFQKLLPGGFKLDD
ncbi:Bifunctional solanapyrone synthase [Paramyrothecium foliicola]|nr:Bifunctional solanapyrone synthase [Paramyrothecium foliicola]